MCFVLRSYIKSGSCLYYNWQMNRLVCVVVLPQSYLVYSRCLSVCPFLSLLLLLLLLLILAARRESYSYCRHIWIRYGCSTRCSRDRQNERTTTSEWERERSDHVVAVVLRFPPLPTTAGWLATAGLAAAAPPGQSGRPFGGKLKRWTFSLAERCRTDREFCSAWAVSSSSSWSFFRG